MILCRHNAIYVGDLSSHTFWRPWQSRNKTQKDEEKQLHNFVFPHREATLSYIFYTLVFNFLLQLHSGDHLSHRWHFLWVNPFLSEQELLLINSPGKSENPTCLGMLLTSALPISCPGPCLSLVPCHGPHYMPPAHFTLPSYPTQEIEQNPSQTLYSSALCPDLPELWLWKWKLGQMPRLKILDPLYSFGQVT